MTSDDILTLIQARHSEDVFVPECKDGASHGSYSRMDAWAMAKSWAHPRICAYEIKVARSDFLRDDKWRRYLNYCNQFYFVCPTGLIDPKELPDDTGLLYVAKTGSMLIQKKKAPHRPTDPAKLEDVFRYLLMARTRICAGGFLNPESPSDFWRAWYAGRKDDTELGHRVSRKLRHVIQEKITKVQTENHKLQKDNERFEEIRQTITKLGLDPRFAGAWNVEDRARRLKEIVPGNLIHDLDHVQRSVTNALNSVREALKEPQSATPE